MADAAVFEDMKRLKDQYYRSFDRSYLQSLVKKIGSDASLASQLKIGEGFHFTAYRVPRSQPMALSVSIAQDSFKDQLGEINVEKWRRNIERLSKLGLKLVPPLELIAEEGIMALVMPYGDAPAESAALHWQPLERLKTDLTAELAKNKLVIDDVLQIHCWQHVPFVVDFSDLKTF
jgi:hypothetical protein